MEALELEYDYERQRMEQFSRKSAKRLRQNQAALLQDHPETANVKIVTSDEIEIQAHKAILKAQCPVFAAMFNCDLSENANGIIRITDITAKTMKIILHYFYQGELLPSWRDPDTIVEFTYAAAKYQMTEVLELLDDMLGGNSGGDASNLDVQLINLTGKLSLKNAENKLLKRILDKIDKLTTSEDLFKLFGYEEEEILVMSERMANEKIGDGRILRFVNSLPSSLDFEGLYVYGMPLLAYMQGKEGLKSVEKDLLKSLASFSKCIHNANTLFDLFDRRKQSEKKD